MAKKVVGKIKLQIQAGKANPSPPVGPALGQHGVNIMDFCKQFNARTESQAGYIIPVVIDVYEDKSFTFIAAGEKFLCLLPGRQQKGERQQTRQKKKYKKERLIFHCRTPELGSERLHRSQGNTLCRCS